MPDDEASRARISGLSREQLINRCLELEAKLEPQPLILGENRATAWVSALAQSRVFCMATSNSRYVFTDVNQAYCNFTGYTREELIGNHISLVVPREDLSNLNRIARAIRNAPIGHGHSHERRFRHKSGRPLWGSVGVSQYRTPNGKESSYLTVVQDITEKKNIERALVHSQHRVRLIAETIPSLLAYITTDLRFEFVNRSYESWFGLPSDRIVGKQVFDVLPASLFGPGSPQIERALSGDTVHFEANLEARDTSFATQISFLPDFDERKVLRGFVSLIEDISSFKTIERELREAQEQLESRVEKRTTALIRSNHQLRREIKERKQAQRAMRQQALQLGQAQRLAKIGFWKLDLSSGILFVSPEMALILEVPYEEVAEIPYADFNSRFVHPGDLTSFEALVCDLPRKGWQYTAEYRVITATGGIKWISELGEAIGTPSGDDLEEIGIIQDVTERKNAETQLTQALKMEAVGQLTGGIAHDFNNLLAVVMGSAELLSTESSNPLAEEIVQAARRGAELTDRLVAFSRSQALVPGPIDVPKQIAELKDMLERTLGETITIRNEVTPTVWPVHADKGQLESALLNLSLNARDAMPGGGTLSFNAANVRIETPLQEPGQTLEPGDYVRICVHDSGNGVDEALLERVFEPFFTTKDIGQGSGLGLAMVYGFTKQSGGDIKISSEPDRGTTVSMLLPRTDQVPVAHTRVDPAAPVGQGEIIVLVEDDDDVRALTAQSLTSLGYRVHAAEDGISGLTLLEQLQMEGVDLLLTDVILPRGMSGPNLARQARSRWPELRVVFMSGYAPNTIIDAARTEESGALLKKPFKISELALSLQKRLRAPV